MDNRKRTISSATDTTTTGSESSSSDDDESDFKKRKTDNDTSDGNQPIYSSFAQKLMSQMGYKKGKGLGKNESGRIDIVEASNQRGRRGLGMTIDGLEAKDDATWNEEDSVMIKQEPDWIPVDSNEIPTLDELNSWTGMSERKELISDEYDFCESQILDGIIENKSIFDKLGNKEFLHSRTRANPYETIRGAIFQNRAAMKMAEIDASFDFMFTNHADRKMKTPEDILYFSDICAGPGGFSEYILWKAKWHAKGFGFTLRADWANDFKIDDFIAGSPETFDCHYGVNGYQGDGDIFREDNLLAFKKYVLENSDGKGVHFVMADGGFSVEGQENIQEILSKQLYLCQFLCALSILRPGGHFVCKVFDLFTPFSIGLVYLMYCAFENVCIFKPVTSRPANSERYLVCRNLKEGTKSISDYMFELNMKINKLKDTAIDIRDVVPLEKLKANESFFDYMFSSNNTLGARQILGLRKLATYVQNTNLVGPDQGEVRKQCLNAWHVPIDVRSKVVRNDPENQCDKLTHTGEWMSKQIATLSPTSLKQIKSIHDYKCQLSGGERVYLFSLGRYSIYKWDPLLSKSPSWKRIDTNLNFELPRLTLLEVEFVYEYKGDGRGQRKVLAIHILDAMYLGGEYIGDKEIGERMKYAQTFVKALSKPCQPDLLVCHVKPTYNMTEISDVIDNLDIKHMKPRMEQRLASHINSEKYFVPRGLYLIKRIKDPWHLQYSRSSKRNYFFNEKSKESLFESPKDSLADTKYCVSTKRYWDWSVDLKLDLSSSKEGVLTRALFNEFVKSKL